MNIKTTKDAKEVFEKVLGKSLPTVIRNSSEYIRIGRIIALNTSTRYVDVQLVGSNQVLRGIQYNKGTTNVNIGDTCLVVSPDPTIQNQSYAIVYGGGGERPIKESYVRAYRQAALNIAQDAYVNIPLDALQNNIGDNWDMAVGKYVTPVPGKYFISGGVGFLNLQEAGNFYIASIWAGASTRLVENRAYGHAVGDDPNVSVADVQILDAGVQIGLYAFHSGTGNLAILPDTPDRTFLVVDLIKQL